jgi:hypothetical protein
LAKSTNHEAPRYAVFPTLPSPLPCYWGTCLLRPCHSSWFWAHGWQPYFVKTLLWNSKKHKLCGLIQDNYGRIPTKTVAQKWVFGSRDELKGMISN